MGLKQRELFEKFHTSLNKLKSSIEENPIGSLLPKTHAVGFNDKMFRTLVKLKIISETKAVCSFGDIVICDTLISWILKEHDSTSIFNSRKKQEKVSVEFDKDVLNSSNPYHGLSGKELIKSVSKNGIISGKDVAGILMFGFEINDKIIGGQKPFTQNITFDGKH